MKLGASNKALEKLVTARHLWQAFGPGWLLFRASYSLQMRAGLMQRWLPATTWDELPWKNLVTNAELVKPQEYFAYRQLRAPRFFFDSADRPTYAPLLTEWDKHEASQSTPDSLVDEIVGGRWRYFEHSQHQVGFPPDWHLNPQNGMRAPTHQHWSRIGDFGLGDIKVIWEPSRFGVAYTLARAYWRSGCERYAELFWHLVQDWREHNQPQQGANWKCGQETSLRVMAWCFGLYAFIDSPATTPDRVVMLAQMIAVSGQRIAANLRYALSQSNNHGISEGVGLWTIGTLFPELQDAASWQDLGRCVLEEEGRRLIYDDGSFAQHSVNYHRLMLHDYLWAIRLADLQQRSFNDELKQRVAQAGEWLYQVQDEMTGRVPYYGQNDGALILPLNNCDYQDFRPVVQASCFLANEERCWESGPWDEDLLWLFGPEALQSSIQAPLRHDFAADDGGYYTLRAPDGFAFVRCAQFRHRPAQADMVHTDIWWKGHNVAMDAGTYSYNAPEPWNNPLAGSAFHNTVTVDGLDQMEKAGKFLWLPWLRGRADKALYSPNNYLAWWEGEHDGYMRLPAPTLHRRGILRIGNEHWLVLDDLHSTVQHEYRLHWLLPDLPYLWKEGQLVLQTSVGSYCVQAAPLSHDGETSLLRADAVSPRGWRAPYYGCREPALSLEVLCGAIQTKFWSIFGPEHWQINVKDHALSIETEAWQAIVELSAAGARNIISSVKLSGAIDDEIRI